MNEKRRAKIFGLSLNVVLLGVVSFFTDLSSEMILPLLPLFLLSMGASVSAIGLIEGIAESTASLLKVYSGWYSDKIGRRKVFISSGYALSAVAKVFF
ncbi:MAG: MFS transporter, partial [Candidatus Hydrothermarchaeaceae archaeon]